MSVPWPLIKISQQSSISFPLSSSTLKHLYFEVLSDLTQASRRSTTELFRSSIVQPPSIKVDRLKLAGLSLPSSPAWWPLRRQWSLRHLLLLRVLLCVWHVKSSKIITTHECQWNMLFYWLGLRHGIQKMCREGVWTLPSSMRDAHIKSRLGWSSAISG